MQHSDFENSTESIEENERPESAERGAVAQVISALDRGDHEAAGNLLREALEKAPEDKQLLRLAAKQRRQAERFTRVYALLKETTEAINDDEFVRAVGAYREAANLSQGFRDLEEATFGVGIEEAGQLGDRNWRIARSLLEDAGRVNPKLVVPDKLWLETRAAEREETISNVLGETALAKPAELGRARERLLRTLEQYPNDSGLINRLKSIESTIDDKRKWDERQKSLKKLSELRDAMQRETEPAEAPKYISQSEALAAGYTGDAEFQSVLEDIKHQVVSCEKAATALKQDRIEDCLEQCAWVLSRMRQHQLFLNLKKQAEERELALVDEYTNSVARIKELLGAGKVAEADALCKKASAQLPQFDDLKELQREIDSRRPAALTPKAQETADSARRHVERGERNLRENQYKVAEQYFSNALKLAPQDAKLRGHVTGLLHGYARSAVRNNPQSAEEVLEMAARLLPGTAVPADLTQAIKQRQERAKDEAARWAALSKLTEFDSRVETAKTREELLAVREDAGKANFAAASQPDVKEAAGSLFAKIDGKVAGMTRSEARRPMIYRVLSLAATVILGITLAYWVGSRPEPEKAKRAETASAAKATEAAAPLAATPTAESKPATGSLVIRSEVPGAQIVIAGKQYTVSDEALKVELNADSYQVKGSRAGYNDFGPVTVAVNKSAETVLNVKLTPKPSSLEIHGAAPGTRIKIDGEVFAKAPAGKNLAKQLPPGEHSIEISRAGFVSRTLTRQVTPGETVVLTGKDLQLESSDARVARNVTPARALTRALTTDQLAETQWTSLDKNNPDALRAFVSQYPDSARAAQAKQQMATVLVARENGDWTGIDHGNRAALEDFLKRYPNGNHTGAAASALADLDRKARATDAQSADEAAWKKVNQHDEASLQAFLRDSPNSRYRNQAEVSLAAFRIARPSAADTSAVLTVISRLAHAWSVKDLDSILAIQRNLNKRTVKAELSQVKQLEMQISPTSPPQIDGTQAIVLCRRQTSQIFSDGTRKDIPDSIVSYVLAKHDGNWTIEGTR